MTRGERRGYAVVGGIPGQDRNICSALLREALASSNTAIRQEQPAGIDRFRGGSPARCLFTQTGGTQQQAVYLSRSLQQSLVAMMGRTVAPTGEAGSYSYYVRAGDHLALHRDVPGCDIAVITCLCDTGGAGGALQLYPGRQTEALDEIHANPEQGAVLVALLPGYSLVLLGGSVPHAVTPVAEAQRRVVSLLCFRVM